MPATTRSLTLAVSAFVAVGIAAAARLLWWYWPGSFFDGATSGIWTALAWNFAHGEFYRPLLGPHGYGGTRYMPLLFIAHGLLIRAHADPIAAGVALMQLSVLAAALALFLTLRSADVPVRLAAPLAGTVWCTVIYQQSCTDLYPDYAAAAFAIFAVGAAIGGMRRTGTTRMYRLGIAAVSFMLAALTKVTALAFAGPVVLALARDSDRTSALWFAGTTAALCAAAVGAVQVASAGQFLDVFRSSLGGGMGASRVWHALPTFVREVGSDPFVAAAFVFAAWALLVAARHGRPTLVHGYFATAVLVTLVIFTAPGTVGNHLVDLQMASALLIGTAVRRYELSPRVLAPAYAAMALVLAAISWPVPGIPSVVATLRAHGPRSRAVVGAIHAEFRLAGARYLSTDPIVPVLNDEPPVLLDAFHLEHFLREGAPAGRDVSEQVRRRAFSAIIVRDTAAFPHDMNADDPGFPEARAHFWATEDDALSRLFRSTYTIRAVRKPFVILLPVTQTAR